MGKKMAGRIRRTDAWSLVVVGGQLSVLYWLATHPEVLTAPIGYTRAALDWLMDPAAQWTPPAP